MNDPSQARRVSVAVEVFLVNWPTSGQEGTD